MDPREVQERFEQVVFSQLARYYRTAMLEPVGTPAHERAENAIDGIHAMLRARDCDTRDISFRALMAAAAVIGLHGEAAA